VQHSILWSGREYHSLENCLLNFSTKGVEINSTIVGRYHGTIYHVDYKIKTNSLWETLLLEFTARLNFLKQSVRLERDGADNWILNGNPAGEFKDCLDVDIPLTPFTNTLPIRRLKFSKNESHEIKVIYCDILESKITPVRQKYTCLSSTEYHYENIPNDFEARIVVDQFGLVVDYPQLFVRSAFL
jgi:uncharacterized protein